MFCLPNSLLRDWERARTPCFPAAKAANEGFPRQAEVAELYNSEVRYDKNSDKEGGG